MQRNQSFKQIFLLVSIFISLMITGFGALLLISRQIRESLISSYSLGIGFGIVCVVFGLFRAVLSITNFKKKQSE